MTSNIFYHSVYFWFHETNMADSVQKTIDACRANLTGIPGILKMTLAVPGGTSGGPVENTYALALLIEFENKAAHDAYDAHPGHQRMITDCGHFWRRVQVYDAAAV